MAVLKQTPIRLDKELLKRIRSFQEQQQQQTGIRVTRADAMRLLLVAGLRQAGL